jgi:hypothetical protein
MAFGFHGAGKARGDLESAAYRMICEQLQELRNAGSRLETQFF